MIDLTKPLNEVIDLTAASSTAPRSGAKRRRSTSSGGAKPKRSRPSATRPNNVYLARSVEQPRYFLCGHADATRMERRLAQHNGSTKYGGRRVRSAKTRGGKWQWALHVAGFAVEGEAERFERSMKKYRSYFRGEPIISWLKALRRCSQ